MDFGEDCPLCQQWKTIGEPCEGCRNKPAAPEPVVWADEASPFTGAQVKALLEENEKLRVQVPAIVAWLRERAAYRSYGLAHPTMRSEWESELAAEIERGDWKKDQ